MKKFLAWFGIFVVGAAVGVVAEHVARRDVQFWKKGDLPAGSVKETDLPAGTLAGLSPAQRHQVLKGVSDRFGRRPRMDPKTVYRIPIDGSPLKGPADALVTVVISSDFECPFCKRVLPTLDQLDKAYAGKIRFSFKHNPLPFHKNAAPAATVAEEARKQGGDAKFWLVHDKLFESNPKLDRASLEAVGAAAGLDAAGLKKALDTNGHKERLDKDQALVRSLGANGTPAFFINGRFLSGARPLDDFKAVVAEELKKAEEMVKGGVAPADLYAKIIEKGATSPGGGPPRPTAAEEPKAPPAPVDVPIRPDDPAKGKMSAPVKIVLFSDFQCPFCGRAENTVEEVRKAYGDKVVVIWKHQPLGFHPNALPASLAAEAAREQGKFWEMHDKIFQNQKDLSPEGYEKWAKELGLNMAKFKAAQQGTKAKSRVEEDQKLAGKVGANGTPTFFINGEILVGAQPFEKFKEVIDRHLQKGAKK